MFNNLIKNSKRRQIFKIIRDQIAHTGKAPTIRELMEAIKADYPREVTYHLEKLEEDGYIKKTSEDSRNIKVLINENEEPVIKLPLVGTASCGPAILAEENILEYIAVPTAFIKSGKNSFLVRASGKSMQPLINEGDLLIARQENEPKTNDLVVALINNEVTVKKLILQDSRYILKPLNPESNEIIVGKSDELKIQGVVVGIVKYLE